MTDEEIIDLIQLTISKPENRYMSPYARTSDKKGFLYIQMIDTKKAAEAVFTLLKTTLWKQ